MRDYESLSKEALLELLATNTSDYTKAIIQGKSPEELDRLKGIVIDIQEELLFRREIYDGSIISQLPPGGFKHLAPGRRG